MKILHVSSAIVIFALLCTSMGSLDRSNHLDIYEFVGTILDLSEALLYEAIETLTKIAKEIRENFKAGKNVEEVTFQEAWDKLTILHHICFIRFENDFCFPAVEIWTAEIDKRGDEQRELYLKEVLKVATKLKKKYARQDL